MATASELQEQLKKAKRELREIREEVKELRIREKLYLERLDNWAEKNQYLNNKISNMTMDEVAQMQKAKAEYNEKYLKDKEVAEAFDKQAQVKLGNLGGE
jgi:uncharacterized coiled-coil DUF342 family protein|tara:strand:+ start:232 stop:531 length:300 start_codon:yes stop_codon:yes gene_type:complete